MYLVDTDIVVSYLNGRADAVALMNSLLPDGIAISVITLGELYEGIYFGADPARHMIGLRHFLVGCACTRCELAGRAPLRPTSRHAPPARAALASARPAHRRDRAGVRSHARHSQPQALPADSRASDLSAAIATHLHGLRPPARAGALCGRRPPATVSTAGCLHLHMQAPHRTISYGIVRREGGEPWLSPSR